MPNMTVTNIDLGGVVLANAEYRDDLLHFQSAGVIKAGTILARDSETLNLVPYFKDGTVNDNGIPKSILTYDVESTQAGVNVAIRDMVTGSVRGDKLIIYSDDNGSNIDASVIDQLRDYSLITINVEELNILDNQ